MPEFRVEFYAFANVNNTIRLRQDIIHVRISDLLEGSPDTVLEAIAHILLVMGSRASTPQAVDPAFVGVADVCLPFRTVPAHNLQPRFSKQCLSGLVDEHPSVIIARERELFPALVLEPEVSFGRK